MDLVQKAITLAITAHAGQYRDGAINGHRLPYILHPIEVVKTVRTWGAGDPVTLAAAVLHDTLEDTSLTLTDLVDTCGEQVANIVRELTYDRDSGLTKPEYLQHFATASIPALVIKLADRYCNVNDFLLTKPAYAKEYFEKATVVISAGRSRASEIAQVLGEETAAAILTEYENLATVLETVA